jgi:hypothetical protein
VNRTDNEFSVSALDQIAQLACAAGRVRFSVFGRKLDLAAGDAAALVNDVDGGLGGLVMPETPGRNHASEVAMMADHDRPGGLRVYVPHQRQIGSAECAARQGDFQKTAAG